MNTKLSLPRITSLLIVLGLVFVQFALLSPVQAATAGVTLSFDSGPFAALPNGAMTVTATETLNESGANTRPNVSSDILFTLNAGADLGGTRVEARNYLNAPIGTAITLNPGQTSFWASAFGGALSRQAVRKQNNQTFVYHFIFTPSKAQAGHTIHLTAQVAVAKNGQLTTNSTKWLDSSNTASADLKVYGLPVLSSGNIAGPYTKAIDGTFQVSISNPADGASFGDGLHLLYEIKSDGSTTPAIHALSYQYSTNNGSTWSAWTDLPASAAGEFGPALGYSQAAGQQLLVNVKVNFSNNGSQLFPVTLSLQDKAGNTLDSLSAFAAVNVKNALLASTDISGPYKAGVAQEFHVTAVNDPVSGGIYSDAMLTFTITPLSPADATLQYYDGNWQNVALSGNSSTATGSYGPFTLNTSDKTATTVKFRINFSLPGTYTINVALKSGNTTIAAPISRTDVLVNPSALSLDLTDLMNNLPFTDSMDELFNASISNPSTGGTYSSLRMNFSISNAALGDITQFEYSLDGGNNWLAIPLTYNSLGGAGYFVPANWTITAPGTILINFRINFARPGTYQMTFNLVDVNTSSDLATQSVYADVQSSTIPITGNSPIFLPLVLH